LVRQCAASRIEDLFQYYEPGFLSNKEDTGTSKENV
jgi:hypothetical protein